MSPYGDMKPSPSEMTILKHLWQAGPQSQREIHDAVADGLGWSRSSTRKTIDRMVEKGALAQRELHGINVYSAKAKKIPTLATMIQSFAADVLSLDGPLPVSTLMKSEILNEQELAELELHLKKLASAQKKGVGE
jgi:predicted transcriptional regulator